MKYCSELQPRNGGVPGIDRDIFPLVEILNKLDFSYTDNISCSGSFQDHNSYVRYDSQGVDKSSHGYILFRADKTHPLFYTFVQTVKDECDGVELMHLGIFEEGYKFAENFALKAVVPEEVLDPKHFQHKIYLTQVWRNAANKIARLLPSENGDNK